MVLNNTFEGNQAKYGVNVSSYAIKIDPLTETYVVDDAIPGRPYPSKIEFNLIDADDQVTRLDSQSIVRVLQLSLDGRVSGTNSIILKEGKASFSSIVFESVPGTQNIKYGLSSNALEDEKLKRVFGDDYTQEGLTVNFRYCISGEALSGTTVCEVCPFGRYSLLEKSTACDNCMDNARCENGNNIFVDAGYWRQFYHSTEIFQCLNEDACEGGYVPQTSRRALDDFVGPTKCAPGYTGYLCHTCTEVDGEKYE